MHTTTETLDASPDHDERIREFLARHGGSGPEAARENRDAAGLSGWSEVTAADGFRLRCEWSRSGTRSEMKFSELPPQR